MPASTTPAVCQQLGNYLITTGDRFVLPSLTSDKGFSWFQFQGGSVLMALNAVNRRINPPAAASEGAWKQYVTLQVLRRNERLSWAH